MRKSPTGDTVIRSGFRRRDHSEPLSQIRNLSALRMKTLRHPIVSVRSHDYDVGEKLVPPYWRSEICHATPRVL